MSKDKKVKLLSEEDSKVLSKILPNWSFEAYGSGDSCENEEINVASLKVG